MQLILGIICMACVANLQYGWTLFVNPIDAKYHWGRAAIQVAFTIFVLIETWLVPVEGYLVDRFGPRWVVLGGGILVAIAWVMNSSREFARRCCISPPPSAASARAAFTAPASATRSSGSRAGAASPPASPPSGFGAGAALTIVPISHMINSAGYEQAFLFFGLLQGGIVFVLAWLLLVAAAADHRRARSKPTDRARLYAGAKCCRARCSTCCM